MLVNQALPLYRHDPEFDGEKWRCNIWEYDQPLFATTWGKTRTEAMSKANSIIEACGRASWKEL